jgi:ankyrin repeat protein
VRELLGRLLEVDYYSNEVRGKVVEVFMGEGGSGGGGGAAVGGGGGGGVLSAVVRLLDEARWVSLQVGDKVKAWNGNNEDTADIAATVTKDNGNGTYAVEYEDPTQLNGGQFEGQTSDNACPESNILDYKETDADVPSDFRGRGKGTRAASLQDRLAVHDDAPAAAMVELLRWSREDMGGDTKRVKALVTITPDLALEGMRAAVRAAGGGDAVGLAFPCRNVGAGNVDAVDAETGMTCLHEVALSASGNVAVASLLLADNANVDAQERKSGKTSLYIAVAGGHLNLARLLIRNGADVNIGDGDGQTPLFVAAEGNRADMVALLIKDGKGAVDKARNDGWTPLLITAKEGHAEIAALLIAEGKADVDKEEGGGGRTPLIAAATYGHTGVAELLVTVGKAAVDKARTDGITPLFMAAQKGNTEVVKLLLTEGNAEVDKTNNNGYTPLYIAAMYGRTEVVKLLLTEGKAEVDKSMNDGTTPLIMAAEQGKTGVVKLLVEGGADLNLTTKSTGDTPLILATWAGKIDVVRLLLEAKADVSIRGDENKTALEWAKKRGHQAIVALLQ